MYFKITKYDMDLHEFLINQNFPRFSPCETGWKKREKVWSIKKSGTSPFFPLILWSSFLGMQQISIPINSTADIEDLVRKII